MALSSLWRLNTNKNKNTEMPQCVQTDVIESVCINCGQEKNKHSKASELCPDRFMHYEQTVL